MPAKFKIIKVMTNSLTIGETINQLHQSLSEYIEATYHISNPQLIEQRKRLLDKVGVIHQKPYLESTPRYQAGSKFAEIDGLPPAALEIYNLLSSKSGDKPQIIYDPPYQHQAASIKGTLVDEKSLIVMTGTGSGKTECFLLPILGKLAREAKQKPHVFKSRSAVRAMVLYPMNALVNDQLGRLRLMLGDSRVVDKFEEWSGRPARFARYTSRTLYPGVRDPSKKGVKKDQDRLRPIGNYYVRHLENALSGNGEEKEKSLKLITELKGRGKFPAKPDLLKWYGKKGMHSLDASGNWQRCVTLPDDPELFTRHEVLEAPADILVTNYSMLEYMLMRPLERPIFNQTRDWLKENPDEKFLLVIDEAHLYRGAAGAEVALLIRRLRSRLEITADRLQVICTSASFSNENQAQNFSAQLTGKEVEDFRVVRGALDLRASASKGTMSDAEILAAIDLNAFYNSAGDAAMAEIVDPFLKYRNVKFQSDLNYSLFEALEQFPPMSLLINLTMEAAQPIESLGSQIFNGTDRETADRAVTVLIALGSLARRNSNEPGLLPCRIHAFFRGFSGLWACLNSECSELEELERGGPTGKLYSQPRESCDHCGSRVLELYTCRNCGSAYARAYTDNIQNPEFLWSEHGERFSTITGGMVEELQPLDILLENPIEHVEPIEIDLDTGRMNPEHDELKRLRLVYIKKNRQPDITVDTQNEDQDAANIKLGEFKPCGVCGESATFGRSSVQDHQTKGDNPFQALITKQLQVQPPSPNQPSTPFAPLRGRKVLIFSDSRQTAARLAPNIQNYSSQDTLRPLIIVGYKRLQEIEAINRSLSLSDVFLAVLIAANQFGLRLRPELRGNESFDLENEVNRAIEEDVFEDYAEIFNLLLSARNNTLPESLVEGIVEAVSSKYYGFESLALASIIEAASETKKILQLPVIPDVAETDEMKLALARAWIYAQKSKGFWLSQMPEGWASTKVKPFKVGRFNFLNKLTDSKPSKKIFDDKWKPELIKIFLQYVAGETYRLRGDKLTFLLDGDWSYCKKCRTNQRPFPGKTICVNCFDSNLVPVDPASDSVFRARKAYYRSPTEEALKQEGTPPFNLIAAEHTAQLSAAQAGDVFSKAEENELLFQDVDLGTDERNRERTAIDVLSCTTTMEVGIDIGSLSGVALRNLPPARANYQQRAGRAGRRGNAVATVIAFGSADSHDEHYFTNPDEMIRGEVRDPFLTLNNYDIARRHITAYLLQRYHQARLPDLKPEDQPHLFAVLGKVSDFKRTDTELNLTDFENWLRTEEAELRESIEDWIPEELQGMDRVMMFDNLIEETLTPIRKAIGADGDITVETENEEDDSAIDETPPEIEDEKTNIANANKNLLDRLLYKGVLPRYAFPTDVATFHVFDEPNSNRFRHEFYFTPSQGLAAALNQYAPGKEVWISGKKYMSSAIYSPFSEERYQAWKDKQLYFECSNCHYAFTRDVLNDNVEKCLGCGRTDTLNDRQNWFRPPGFAHPVFLSEKTSIDDTPPKSYATHAKLDAYTPVNEADWTMINGRCGFHYMKDYLLVTNRGPRGDGYNYCTICGLISPTTGASKRIDAGGAHKKPYPDEKQPDCPGNGTARRIVLGTDFITDILLISLKVDDPLRLTPGYLPTEVALRTVSEALSAAACNLLELESTEIQAEFRPALTSRGNEGYEAEIYLYDTLSGGAGFVRQASKLGAELLKEALCLLGDCHENCDSSCYRCLRSYKNKFEHSLLDRHIGKSLLEYVLSSEIPTIEANRARQLDEMLFVDLERQEAQGLTVTQNEVISVAGLGEVEVPILAKVNNRAFVIDVASSLTPHYSNDEKLRDLKDFSPITVLTVDELTVRRNLPSVTSGLLAKMGIVK